MPTPEQIRQQERELARRRFLSQVDGTAKREYPNGRIGPEDEGAIAIAIAADKRHQVVRIAFGKLISEISLDSQGIESLCRSLNEKLMELRGIDPNN